MIDVKTQNIKDCEIQVPGSKSYTHRLLIAAALSEGQCEIKNILESEDTFYTLSALEKFGIKICKKENSVLIDGTKGILKPCREPIYLGNSGTSMRLLMGVAAIGNSKYVLTGTPRMCERPVNSLLDALNQLLVSAVSVNKTGSPPVEIKGSGIKERKVNIDCSISSQYLSSLLLIAPYTLNGLEINVIKGPVSKPYIDMTIDIMRQLNIDVTRKGYNYFKILPNQVYKAGKYAVEPDCSQAGYFWAAAAVTGKKIKVLGISPDTKQGDVRFANVLKSMGCNVFCDHDGISVTGGKLYGIEVDMADMPDMVPTLAVVAAFAKGKTVIKNVEHLKAKESDRLGSVVAELKKMGVDAFCDDSTMVISGGRKPAGAVIKTYDDHRMAMSFAIAGLIVPNISIEDEKCVGKSFPNFWEVFKGMYE